MKHPPGKKVYQRGAHTIWEVDGAKEKVRCLTSRKKNSLLKDVYSFTVKILHSSGNFSLMSKLCSLTAITVSC